MLPFRLTQPLFLPSSEINRSLMAYTPTDQPSTPNEAASPGERGLPDQNARDIVLPDYPAGEHPQLMEEHHVVGPDGEDQIEATDDRGRRWYHLRPEPRGRLDLVGFNYTWWLIWILFLFIIFAPWGRGWGY
jgi:hypothetical protein